MRTSLTAIALGIAVAATAGAAVGASAPNAVNSYSGTCVVSKPAKAKGPVTVKITASNLASAFLPTTGCQQAVTIVNKVAKTGIQQPFRSGYYACTPSISGSTGTWKCTFQAADTPGKATLSFTYRY